ncbi:hypothetical protein KAFR_0D01370 [Kazachstania africana CBS 2517]|uniref:Pet127p n=1 Tax=Kazachstania africana (strain ATCC 22294 / BCRC 22015 / CBS 2517 / CECT 1963 / NBRC 1671 / NRRL Y-8276) TaxID=1071382 RepID=H2ATT3_KAZAF|nr:hypothetical protein KAFR_0D01370 [Kazachstania africana CBS 2517]CCF57783.1 hypothetical protein KAFR_0D01370 [Kazachstania africana CBS 2517]
MYIHALKTQKTGRKKFSVFVGLSAGKRRKSTSKQVVTHNSKNNNKYVNLEQVFEDSKSRSVNKLIVPDIIRAKSTHFTLIPKDVIAESVVPEPDPNTNEPVSHPPELAFQLNKILYQPTTLHLLQDQRSGVYNFDPKLEKITPNFLKCRVFSNDKRVPFFLTPHKDSSLLAVAKKFDKRYVSSTSSMTSILSQLHFLVSNFRKLNITDSSISKNFPQKQCDFTTAAQFPASIILRKKPDGIISIDSDKTLDREIILSILGHSLEDFLTKKRENDKNASYHYMKIDAFMLRSQLDAYDSKLPGSGIFDLKTRAVTAIRHDLSYVESNNNFTGYEIDKVYGKFESLEREYFELIRSTLLKYALQARIGNMDGIFVAYHNISKMFGFQYLPLEELDYIIHSSIDSNFAHRLNRKESDLKMIFGDLGYILHYQRKEREIASKIAATEFKISLMLLKHILSYIEKQFDNKFHPSDTWNNCKVMIKTEKAKRKMRNGQIIHYPVLKVIAVPLASDYEDQQIISSGSTNDMIVDQIQQYNAKIRKDATSRFFKEKAVGLEIRLLHKLAHHPDASKLPSFLISNKELLTTEQIERIKDILSKNYYPTVPTHKSPNFFDPSDIDMWEVNVTMTPIDNLQELQDIYIQYNTTKTKALESQSLVVDRFSDLNQVSTIDKEITEILRNLSHSKKLENEPSKYQGVLRAYSLKGLRRTKKNSKQKIMWND